MTTCQATKNTMPGPGPRPSTTSRGATWCSRVAPSRATAIGPSTRGGAAVSTRRPCRRASTATAADPGSIHSSTGASQAAATQPAHP